METKEKEKCARFRDVISYLIENSFAKSKKDVASATGLTYAYVNNLSYSSSKVTVSALNKLKYTYPFVNIDWIKSGNGTMILSQHADIQPKATSPICVCLESVETQLQAALATIGQLKQLLK